jgi:hypothetical protein
MRYAASEFLGFFDWCMDCVYEMDKMPKFLDKPLEDQETLKVFFEAMQGDRTLILCSGCCEKFRNVQITCHQIKEAVNTNRHPSFAPYPYKNINMEILRTLMGCPPDWEEQQQIKACREVTFHDGPLDGLAIEVKSGELPHWISKQSDNRTDIYELQSNWEPIQDCPGQSLRITRYVFNATYETRLTFPPN